MGALHGDGDGNGNGNGNGDGDGYDGYKDEYGLSCTSTGARTFHEPEKTGTSHEHGVHLFRRRDVSTGGGGPRGR